MMHRNLFRPLALAAVGCLLAFSLTGCSMSDFVRFAKNSKLMEDETSASSTASASTWKSTLKERIQKAQEAARAKQEAAAASAAASSSASSSASEDTAEEPAHEYDPPNAECDAKISELVSELHSLESEASAAVSSAIQSARDEYHRTGGNKYLIAYSHLSAVQSEYDSKVSSIISEMRSILREYNQPETVADEAESYYASAKASMISSLM